MKIFKQVSRGKPWIFSDSTHQNLIIGTANSSHRLSGADPRLGSAALATLHHALFTPHRQPTAEDSPMLGSGWAQHVTQVSFFWWHGSNMQDLQNLRGVRSGDSAWNAIFTCLRYPKILPARSKTRQRPGSGPPKDANEESISKPSRELHDHPFLGGFGGATGPTKISDKSFVTWAVAGSNHVQMTVFNAFSSSQFTGKMLLSCPQMQWLL